MYYSYQDAVKMRHMLQESAKENNTSPEQQQRNTESVNTMVFLSSSIALKSLVITQGLSMNLAEMALVAVYVVVVNSLFPVLTFGLLMVAYSASGKQALLMLCLKEHCSRYYRLPDCCLQITSVAWKLEDGCKCNTVG